MSTEQLATRDDIEIVRLDPQALIAQAIEKGSGMDTLERLVALAKEVNAERARGAWYAAMAEFQRRCPAIKKTGRADIRSAKGSYSYRYAPLDEITSTIQPVMGELGLSLSWRSRVEPAQVIVSCRISHVLGHHEESGDIAIPIVQGDGTGATPPQRVGIATTYAKRYSLLGIIGMAPEDDDDGAHAEPAKPAPAGAPTAKAEALGQEARAEQDGEKPPSYEPFGAITMLQELGNGRVDGKMVEGYFGPGVRTKGQLDALKGSDLDAFKVGYDRLRTDYHAGKAGATAGAPA